MEFFTSWQIKTVGFIELFAKFNQNEPVWQGEDGGYAVGNVATFDLEMDDGTEYVEAGTVKDYLQ